MTRRYLSILPFMVRELLAPALAAAYPLGYRIRT
jgi:hypothetical protein